jgi:ribA/ribD-fused uncharacterized protein
MSVDPTRWRRERWDEPSTIYFWSGRGGEYQSLSNFAATPFVMAAWQSELGVVEFATAEHAFQAAKAANASEHERIRLAATPLDAKRAGRRAQLPGDWDRRRLDVMLTVVRAKFAAGPLRDLLVGTGDRLLAEDSPYDAVWGCRDRMGGYTGANLLGRALMRVRDELREPRIEREGLVLLRVTGPRFVAGAEADQGRITRTAPMIKRLRGRPLADALTLAKQQGWSVEVISPTTGRDNNTRLALTRRAKVQPDGTNRGEARPRLSD